MSSLSNILEYIRLHEKSVRGFEKKAELANSTLKENAGRDADLSSENVEKISAAHGEKIRAAGYYIVNVSPFATGKYWVVLNKEEMLRFEKGPAEPKTQNEKARPEGQAKGIEERIKEIDERTERLAASLSKVLKGQEGIPALIGEILRRDIFQEAGGNPDIADEILKEILRRIGPKLSSDVKAGIGADGHNGGMENP